MTKAVRIENADTSTHKVVVETWDVGRDGTNRLLDVVELGHPTAMTSGVYITSTRYLVVREAAVEAPVVG